MTPSNPSSEEDSPSRGFTSQLTARIEKIEREGDQVYVQVWLDKAPNEHLWFQVPLPLRDAAAYTVGQRVFVEVRPFQ